MEIRPLNPLLWDSIFPPSPIAGYEHGTHGEVFYHEVFPDGREAVVVAHSYGSACIKMGDPNIEVYDDTWEYSQGVQAAMESLKAWDGSGGEPEGWTRHPSTGRRREGGDPAKEIIRM